MWGWIIGIVVVIIILLVVLKLINKKDNVTRMPGLEDQTSGFRKFLDKCCSHKKNG